jgi:hypothetical protein
MRLMINARGHVMAVDRGLNRVTVFDSTGAVRAMQPLGGAPVAADFDPSDGSLWVLMTGVVGTGPTSTIVRFDASLASVGEPVALVDSAASANPFERALISLAVRSRDAFFAANGLRSYRILSMAAGSVAHIERDLARPQMSDEEHAVFTRQMADVMAKVAARTGNAPRATRPPPRDKPHLAQDGLRIDARGRLWALTGRGDSRHAVVDLFDHEGSWIGELHIPQPVTHYALAGGFLVTSAADVRGTPTVTLWRVIG